MISPISEFVKAAEMHVAALNQAIDGIPRDRVRLHCCWGNWNGPHLYDVALDLILPVLYQANVGALSIEFGNPRHQHELEALRRHKLPDHMLLLPGVVESNSNIVEHPEVVARRLEEAVAVVGDRERVIASADCGFGTFTNREYVIEPVVWLKLKALRQGADIAIRSSLGARSRPITCAHRSHFFSLSPARQLFAQVDLSGEWASRYTWDYLERLPGPELGDYLGLPINNAARLKANSWEASTQTIPERQCIPHGADYLFSRAGFPMRIWTEEDPTTQKVIAIRIRSYAWSVERTIWMDGRPHPSKYARHTWQGFSTGQWNANVLTVTTTHLKWNYIRRNGVPRSDEATVTEHFARHGDYLTLLTYIDDPVYLTEPLLRTSGYVLDPQQQLEPFPCEPVEEVVRPEGAVPHHLPGTNKDIDEFPAKYGLPAATAMGGAETMYPGYAIPAGPEAAWLTESKPRPASKSCPSKRTSTCSRATAATSRCRSATTACCWSTPALRK